MHTDVGLYVPQVICNALGLFWVTERAKPRFSPDMEIGKTDTIGPTHGGCNTERRAMVPPNIVESFSSSGGLEEEESGYLDPRQEIICNTESPRKSVSTFRLRDTLRPSTVKSRANSRSGSTPSPWSMGTIVSLFLKGQEPHPDDLPLEVGITNSQLKGCVSDVGWRSQSRLRWKLRMRPSIFQHIRKPQGKRPWKSRGLICLRYRRNDDQPIRWLHIRWTIVGEQIYRFVGSSIRELHPLYEESSDVADTWVPRRMQDPMKNGEYRDTNFVIGIQLFVYSEICTYLDLGHIERYRNSD